VNDEIEQGMIANDRLTVSKSSFSPKSIVDKNLYRLLCKEKKLHFDLMKDFPEHTYLIGDYSKIRVISDNLISNAIRYTNEGSVQVNIQVQPNHDVPNHSFLIIKVKDTGIGIPPSQHDKIFELYQGSEHKESSGIGLFRVKAYANKMDGDLQIQSKPNVGTEFTFKISLSHQGNSSTINRSVDHKFPNHDLSGCCVLVAEDQMTIRRLMLATLKKYNLHVILAEDGLQAVEQVKKNSNKIQLIFMDLQMPNMGGVEATEIIRSLGFKAPIICFSAEPSHQTKERCIKAGFSDFIPKLIRTAHLNRVLNLIKPIT
jgi:CheY-like chemotaxis protein/anti-sigma regulatory factor (Ser/Thr protein kinase)